VLVIKRRVPAIHQTRIDEMNEFGRLLPLICKALSHTLTKINEYVFQMAEGEGYNHVHFHIITRLPDWLEELRGVEVISGIGNTAK